MIQISDICSVLKAERFKGDYLSSVLWHWWLVFQPGYDL